MKNLICGIQKSCFKFIIILQNAILSFIYPLVENIADLVEVIGVSSEKIVGFISSHNEKIKKYINYSFVIYYVLLIILEIYFFISILKGKISYYSFSELTTASIIIMIYSFVFVRFLNKNFKSNKFNYIIYLQILFLLPIIVVYWIANIEGHDLYLKNLNSDQWISLFNTIIIYFSGCLIGIITLYKSNKNNKHNN